MNEKEDTRPPLPKPIYRRVGLGAVCRVCQGQIRKVCAAAYYQHGRSMRHQIALQRFKDE